MSCTSGFLGSGPRPSGTITATMDFPSAVQLNVVTFVASSDDLVNWRALAVAGSKNQMCVAVSVNMRNASVLPSFDHDVLVATRAPAGTGTWIVLPVSHS